jgi:hypothetical protein
MRYLDYLIKYTRAGLTKKIEDSIVVGSRVTEAKTIKSRSVDSLAVLSSAKYITICSLHWYGCTNAFFITSSDQRTLNYSIVQHTCAIAQRNRALTWLRVKNGFWHITHRWYPRVFNRRLRVSTEHFNWSSLRSWVWSILRVSHDWPQYKIILSSSVFETKKEGPVRFARCRSGFAQPRIFLIVVSPSLYLTIRAQTGTFPSQCNWRLASLCFVSIS